jgi:general secretion pathway protein J
MKGFTLVEMMVALLIFGMLAAAGVAVMRSTVDSQAAVRGRVDRIAQFQRLRASLKADLGQAAARRTRGEDGVLARSGFAGGAEGGPLLSLVRRGWENPDGLARPSLQYVEYRQVEDRLERRVRTALDGAPLQTPQILAEGVEASGVAFFAREQWSPAWADPGALPEAVRVDLTLAGVGPVSQLFLTPAGAR